MVERANTDSRTSFTEEPRRLLRKKGLTLPSQAFPFRFSCQGRGSFSVVIRRYERSACPKRSSSKTCLVSSMKVFTRFSFTCSSMPAGCEEAIPRDWAKYNSSNIPCLLQEGLPPYLRPVAPSSFLRAMLRPRRLQKNDRSSAFPPVSLLPRNTRAAKFITGARSVPGLSFEPGNRPGAPAGRSGSPVWPPDTHRA